MRGEGRKDEVVSGLSTCVDHGAISQDGKDWVGQRHCSAVHTSAVLDLRNLRDFQNDPARSKGS